MTATTERTRMTKAAMQARIDGLTARETMQDQTIGVFLDRLAKLEKDRDELIATLRQVEATQMPSAVDWYRMQALIARCEGPTK